MTTRHLVAVLGAVVALQGCGLTARDPDGTGGTGGAAVFECVGAHWKRLARRKQPRMGHRAAAWRDNTVVVWGGVDAPEGGAKTTSTGWRIGLDGTMSALPLSGAPSGRSPAAFGILGDHVLVWGGYSVEQAKYLDDGARLDLLSDQWSPLPSTQGLLAPRHSAAHGVVGTRWLVWGGISEGEFQKDGAVWDPEQDAWSPVVDAPIVPMWPTLVEGDPQFGPVVLATEPSSGPSYAYGFDPQAWAWWELPDAGGPGFRVSAAATFCAATREVIIWGGSKSKEGWTNSGERYSRAQGWRSLSTVGAPTPRARHYAAVVGTKLVILGATSPEDSGELASGGVYDLLADSWSPLPADDCAPPPRFSATLTAFGDGKSVLLWGGHGPAWWEEEYPEQGWVLTL